MIEPNFVTDGVDVVCEFAAGEALRVYLEPPVAVDDIVEARNELQSRAKAYAELRLTEAERVAATAERVAAAYRAAANGGAE